MKIDISQTSVYVVFFLIVAEAFLFFLGTEIALMPDLIIYFVRGSILGISLLYLIRNFSERELEKTPIHKSLTAFIIMFIAYGFFSEQWMQLRTVLFVLTIFFFFYYVTYKGYLKIRHLQILALMLFCIFALETWHSIFARAERFHFFFVRADNVGYKSMYLMLLFALDLRKTRNILFLTITYSLVLLSFKRGAVIIASIIYAISLWPIFSGTGIWDANSVKRSNLIIITGFVLVFIIVIIISYWDVLVYRFVADTSGGSGREQLYSRIYEGWRQGSSFKHWLGYGLLEVHLYIEEMYGEGYYAHSDWMQLLFDHGILGITVYLLLFVSCLFMIRIIKHFAPELFPVFLMTLIVWLFKSVYSGIYVYKDSIFLFLTVGFITGIAYRRRNKRRRKKENPSLSSALSSPDSFNE